MTILDRYIIGETLRPLAMALLAFVTLLTGHMLFRVVEMIVEHGVAWRSTGLLPTARSLP